MNNLITNNHTKIFTDKFKSLSSINATFLLNFGKIKATPTKISAVISISGIGSPNSNDYACFPWQGFCTVTSRRPETDGGALGPGDQLILCLTCK